VNTQAETQTKSKTTQAVKRKKEKEKGTKEIREPRIEWTLDMAFKGPCLKNYFNSPT
jgi:hypothetical protein